MTDKDSPKYSINPEPSLAELLGPPQGFLLTPTDEQWTLFKQRSLSIRTSIEIDMDPAELKRRIDGLLEKGKRIREEREQLLSLLDKHEDWLVEEINRRKEERERKAREEAQQTSYVEPSRWEPPPSAIPGTGWRYPTNPPWYRAAIDDLQQRIDRANGPYRIPEEGWD
ncbi:hypothetical protein [Streptomyces coeruleorubidus]|uniref:hypothetical protein n=1 Tax=Streptomyces coeruleorubidus TaxID=116188 RepID=UPI00379FED26